MSTSRKVLIGLAVLVLILLAFNFMSGPETTESSETDEEKTGVTSEKGIGGLRESFKNILPGEQDEADLGKHETDDPHVVVIAPEGNEMDVDDVNERLETFKDANDHEGLDFARWAILSAKYAPDEKERILLHARDHLPADEVTMLSHDVLVVGTHPELYPTAIMLHTRNMNEKEMQDSLNEILQKKDDAKLRDAVNEFLSTRNMHIR